ncbi:MAG: prepilin peptidase [Planctomycetaceae bacterium]|nr:prepilin peptidase [Planctomycetaceae bacterium]
MQPGIQKHDWPAGTLSGEYLLLFAAGHASICGLMAVVQGGLTLTTLLAVLAGLWMIARWQELFSGRLLSLGVTFVLAVLCVSVFILAPPATPVLFSLPVLATLLFCSLLLDADQMGRQLTDGQLRSAQSWALRHGMTLLVICFVLLVFVSPLAIAGLKEILAPEAPPNAPQMAMDRLTFSQELLFRFCESMTAFFFFTVGACVGSFLNVVIYRVPLGISTLVKASHCPSCSQKIHSKDNSPLIGWLRLGGKCRNCDLPISARYPVVELTIGLLFLLLYYVQLISGGINLAGRNTPGYAGVLWILFYTKWPLVWLYVYHCVAFCTMFAWSMIRFDGQRVPRFSVALMLGLLFAVPFLKTSVQPYPVGIDGAYSSALAYPGVISAVGIVAALAVSGLLSLLKDRIPPTDIGVWLLLGTALGWQAVVGMACLLLIASGLHRLICGPGLFSGDRAHWAWLVLPCAAVVHHCLWKAIALLPVV